ncbi:PREDICTED: collagen alpha-1(X) chain-like [Bison bison bison]|uniref:Collagen alpha-1(X) chain-like n=1 Tax=Bison bison bison TaxID=43346 RepID=A0A6P3J974_BISBB|nr:PREDICTED: collagen alpha-1(X) chain-like [Bison bison bison]
MNLPKESALTTELQQLDCKTFLGPQGLKALDLGEEILKGCAGPCGNALPLTGGEPQHSPLPDTSQNVFSPDEPKTLNLRNSKLEPELEPLGYAFPQPPALPPYGVTFVHPTIWQLPWGPPLPRRAPLPPVLAKHRAGRESACLPGPQARHPAGGGCGFPGTRGQAQAAPCSPELSPELRLPRKTPGNSGPGPVADRPSSGCRGPMRPAESGPRGAPDAPAARLRPGPPRQAPRMGRSLQPESRYLPGRVPAGAGESSHYVPPNGALPARGRSAPEAAARYRKRG